MKFVYVLEDESRFQKEIFEAILAIDPKIQVRFFSRLEEFVNWLRVAMVEGSKAIAKGGSIFGDSKASEPLADEDHKLVLVISKIEFLGVKQLSLLRKTRHLFIERNICSKDDPTSIVLTAFDDPHFKIRQLEDRILSNIIFKPLDRLILLQHLTFAIDGRHPPSKYTIQNQKTTAVFEILKEAPLIAISEFGFVTTSNRPIEKGRIAKYYGSYFETERHRSIMGVCQSCEPVPGQTDQYQVTLQFFAADPIQVSNTRKRVRDTKSKIFQSLSAANSNGLGLSQIANLQIVIVDPDEQGVNGVGGTFERRISGAKVTVYRDFTEFYSDLDPSQQIGKESLKPPFESGSEAIFEISPAVGTLKIKDKTLFGLNESEWKDKNNWLMNLLDSKTQERWKRLIRPVGLDSADSPYFYFKTGPDSHALLKFKSRDRNSSGNWLLTFSETSKEELVQYLSASSKLPAQPHLILFSHRFLGENSSERWLSVKEIFRQRGFEVKLMMLSSLDHTDAQERDMAQFLDDIFFKPVDRSYLISKIANLFSPLQLIGDAPVNHFIQLNEDLRVANPIVVKEFSEAGFIMEYYRPISIGSFREVILWQPYEVGAPELVANCNYTEEATGKKGVYLNHFVFFGMTDHFLKSIRVWIRNNYILSKESGS